MSKRRPWWMTGDIESILTSQIGQIVYLFIWFIILLSVGLRIWWRGFQQILDNVWQARRLEEIHPAKQVTVNTNIAFSGWHYEVLRRQRRQLHEPLLHVFMHFSVVIRKITKEKKRTDLEELGRELSSQLPLPVNARKYREPKLQFSTQVFPPCPYFTHKF